MLKSLPRLFIAVCVYYTCTSSCVLILMHTYVYCVSHHCTFLLCFQEFQGNHLPFVGFTYYKDVKLVDSLTLIGACLHVVQVAFVE